MQIKPATRLRGELAVPGDKSISHRSVMLGAIADGTTQISGFLNGADCLSTINCFEKMGIEININGDSVAVIGRGLHGLRKPDSVLFTGNSGTTTRLLAGLMKFMVPLYTVSPTHCPSRPHSLSLLFCLRGCMPTVIQL